MKDKRKDDDLDERYWVRLNGGRIVSRMHYDRITDPPFKPQHEPSPETLAKNAKEYNDMILKYYKEHGLPVSELKEICGLLVAPYERFHKEES